MKGVKYGFYCSLHPYFFALTVIDLSQSKIKEHLGHIQTTQLIFNLMLNQR